VIDPWYGSAGPSWHSNGKLLEESDFGLGYPMTQEDRFDVPKATPLSGIPAGFPGCA